MFTDSTGATVRGAQIDYNGQPAGYTGEPQEVINYVDAHDNETLYDALTYKLPVATSMADRVRMQPCRWRPWPSPRRLVLAPGADLLRSKSFDGNSYDSGDWFNRLDRPGTTTGSAGACRPGDTTPSGPTRSRCWPTPRSSRPGRHGRVRAAQDLLRLRFSTPLFRLGSAQLRSRGEGRLPGPGLPTPTRAWW